MSLTLGARMRRSSDGMTGVVEDDLGPNGHHLRISYYDRGERHWARPREEWVPADPGRLPMRDEEIAYVAELADLALRSVDEHKPFAWWDSRPIQVHDAGLIRVVTEYLKARV